MQKIIGWSAHQAHQAHEGLTLSEAAKSYRFWILLLSILFAYMGFSGIGPNLFPSMTDDGFNLKNRRLLYRVSLGFPSS